jgi:CheY-like chemotaxis protein
MKATKMVQTEKLQPAEILMIEDSETDVLLAREALEQAKVVNNLHVLEDGASAMEYLHQRGKYSNATRPHLILLDLNLPKKSGQEVLAEIKADPALSRSINLQGRGRRTPVLQPPRQLLHHQTRRLPGVCKGYSVDRKFLACRGNPARIPLKRRAIRFAHFSVGLAFALAGTPGDIPRVRGG